MARLLISTNSRNGRFGTVVAVMPDNHVWGRKERQPDFIRIDIPGVPRRKFKPFVQAVLRKRGVTDPENFHKLDQISQRRFRLKPQMVQNMIDAGQWRREVTATQLRKFAERLKDNGERDRDVTQQDLDDAEAAIETGDGQI